MEIQGQGRAEYVSHSLRVGPRGTAKIIVFENGMGSALVFGEPTDGSLVRIQSACQYGEIYGSVECDCRAQLDTALQMVKAEGAGVIVHLLNQEGRGQGLKTKARAYKMREQEGLDTFKAYGELGVDADVRNYEAVARLLKKQLELHEVTLLTNNPAKIEGLEKENIDVVRRPLIVHTGTSACAEYFETKLAHGHLERDEAVPGRPGDRSGETPAKQLKRPRVLVESQAIHARGRTWMVGGTAAALVVTLVAAIALL